MTMTAPDFLARYRTLKAQLDTVAASAELLAASERLNAAFKTAYTSDSLREALTAAAPVSAELEERLTSALVLFNRERTLSASRQVPDATAPPPDEA